MNKGEFQEEIRKLEDAGIIRTEKTRDGEVLKFTDEGLEATELAIGLNTDMQLFLFQLFWENYYSDLEDQHLRMIKIAEAMRDEMEINILRTIEFEEDRLEGIEVRKSLPEKFLQHFDP